MAAAASINAEGWKPETRYNNGVLVGNWNEERRNWQSFHYPISSTHRHEFRDFSSQRPDKLLRLKEKVRYELGSSDVFMKAKDQPEGSKLAGCNYPYLVTWYDEDYNRKERPECEKLPALRRWDLQTIAWRPERSDHPISHPPTNWGLTAERNKRWNHELATEGKGVNYNTTYSASYTEHDLRTAAAQRRFAVPRELSTHFVPNNRTHLILRSTLKSASLQIPEPPLCNLAEQIQATHLRIQEQGRQLQDKLNSLTGQQEPLIPQHPCTR